MATFTEKKTKKGETRHLVQIRRTDLRKPVSKTFTLKKDAKAWARDTEAAIERGEFSQDETNFGLLCRRYSSELWPIQKWGRTKSDHIEYLRRSPLGRLQLKDLTTKAIMDYAMSRGRHPSTVMGEMIQLGVILSTAKDMWELDYDLEVYRKAHRTLKRIGVIGESDHRDTRCTDKELDLILENVGHTKMPIADLARFAIHTAMRRAEVVRLEWDDLDLTEGEESVLIRRRKHPKKKRDERVPLLPEAVEIIKKQIAASGDEKFIFPYDGDSVSNAFRKAREKAGVGEIRWHDLRHEGCSRLFERGLDAMTVSLFSGHKDLNMLKRYTHLTPKSVLSQISQSSLN